MTEPSQADAVPADVPRFEAPSDTPDAPPDPCQASLQRAQRSYQTGWSSPWADDAIRAEGEVVPEETAWQPPAAEQGRKGLAGLFRRRSTPAERDAQASPTPAEQPAPAFPAAPAPDRGVPQQTAAIPAPQPPIQPVPRRMAPDPADSAV